MDQDQLHASSQRWMVKGLAAFSEGEDYDFAVHHLGIAVEHLLKAYLASLHPALVAEPKDWESLLHAIGYGERSGRLSTRTKTIGLGETFTRVRKLLRGRVNINDTEFEQVLAARNGVAHAAHHESSETHRVVATCVRIMDVVLTELGTASEGYWGDYFVLHNQLIAERTNDLLVKVEAQRARAKEVFRQRIDGLPDKECAALIGRLSAINLEDVFADSRTADCPACIGSGWLHGFINVDWEDEDPEGAPAGHVTFIADGYDCAVCGLHLGGDELEIAGLQTEIDLPDENPYEAYEPDEDLWRGR